MNEIHIQEHSSPIKNWKQLLVVAVLAFVVPVLLIVATVQIITGGLNVDPTSLGFSEEAVAARLKPVGEVRLARGRWTTRGTPPGDAGSNYSGAWNRHRAVSSEPRPRAVRCTEGGIPVVTGVRK